MNATDLSSGVLATSTEGQTGDREHHGNLSVIPTTATDENNGNRRTTSYIEYNDGKVCWYYPIFPEYSGGNYSHEGGTSSNQSLLRHSNEGEDYSDFRSNQLAESYGEDYSSQYNWRVTGHSNWPLDPATTADTLQRLDANMNQPQEFTNPHFYNSKLIYGDEN